MKGKFYGENKPLLANQLQEDSCCQECPEKKASFLSRLTLWWATNLAVAGYRKPLTLQDLWPLDQAYSATNVANKFNANWDPNCVNSENDESDDDDDDDDKDVEDESVWKSAITLIRSPGLMLTLIKTFRYELIVYSLVVFGSECMTFLMPQLIKLLIGFVSESNSIEYTDSNQFFGYSLALLIFLASNCQSLVDNCINCQSSRVRMQMRAALLSAVYHKSFRLSNSSRTKFTTGEIQNLSSTHIDHVISMGMDFNWLWSIPLQICLTGYLLWMELGVAMVAGIVIIVGTLVLNLWAVKYENRLYTKQSQLGDERMKVINEVLNGIRVIKLYGWEMPFIGKVSSIRQNEVDNNRKIMNVNALNALMFSCSSFLVFLSSFTVYVLSKNTLTPEKIFVSMFLFSTLRGSLGTIPYLISNLNYVAVSLRKLNRFLSASQLENYVTRHESSDCAIDIQNGTFAWGKSEEDKEKKVNPILSEIDLKVKKGQLVAIVGNVGSGKSSLLSAILGDMDNLDGTVNVAAGESIAFVSQQAWIQNSTIRGNILFGSKYDKSKFNSIIDKCALRPDLPILSAGDQTEIGEKGINLSGGQKQRVAIARACYSNASIVLLDDPLSAVDCHVSRHIFSHVLSSSTGYLRNRTRVLVTNQITFLSDVDQIIVLSNGSVSERGTYQQLIQNNGHFAKLAREHSNQNSDQTGNDSALSSDSSTNETNEHFKRQKSMGDIDDDDTKNEGKLIEEENTEKGHVKMSVYLKYAQSVSWTCIGMAAVAMIATELAYTGASVWLALWSGDSEAKQDTLANATTAQTSEMDGRSNNRLVVYALFGLAQAVFVFAGMKLLATGTTKSSVKFHRELLDKVIRSPMQFFDTTPLGRIETRFSKDIDSIDSGMMWNIDAILNCAFSVISSITIILIKVPILLFVVLPISLLYFYIQKIFIAATRQLDRLRSVHKSPINSHLSETLNGLDTIRAFDCAQAFVDESNRRVDTFQRVNYPDLIISQWLRLRLEFLGNLVQLFTAIFVVASKSTLEAGFVGLIVTHSGVITRYLNWAVSCTSDLEKSLVSVERIDEYCHKETEREWNREENKNPELPDNWPEKGEIEFVDYSLRYREGLDLVLDGLDFKVKGCEKVGIVGRTGAGKSSLTLALFRIVERAGGKILIDGVDIDRIGLHELRNKLTIIPQDPVLFSGTIRTNLDPFGVCRDELLNSVLEQCHLSTFINSHQSGLDYKVSENGSNLSVGQRQLICLARALLRQTPILVLDEATAAIDLQTDALIQQTIRKEFAHCTVLTIAHRLNTILDSDRVLVLDQGKVAEFDTPTNLLANTNSKFYSLAQDE